MEYFSSSLSKRSRWHHLIQMLQTQRWSTRQRLLGNPFEKSASHGPPRNGRNGQWWLACNIGQTFSEAADRWKMRCYLLGLARGGVLPIGLLFVLFLLAVSHVSAQVTIRFSEGGGGTTSISASGTGVIDDDSGSGTSFLGFIGPDGGYDNRDLRDFIPSGLVGFSALGSGNLLDPITLNVTGFGNILFSQYTFDFSAASFIPLRTAGGATVNPVTGGPQTLSVVDGVGALPIPFSSFSSLVGLSFPSNDGWLFVFGPEAVALPISSSTAIPAPQPVLLTDVGAIHSLLTTGLSTALAQRSLVQNAPAGALRDLNDRLFRARTRLEATSANGITSTFEPGAADRTLANFIAFNANQGIDSRVALGLRDAGEVEVANTLNQGQQALWFGSPVALLGGPLASAAQPFASATPVAPAPPAAASSGKDPVADGKIVFEPVKRWQIITAFDYGYYDQDNLSQVSKAFDTDSYAATVGVEYLLTDWLAVGAAWSRLESNTELTGNLGGIDLEGSLLSGYLTAFVGNTWADVLYAYGNYDNEISRNTLLGSRALGDTESYSHNLAVNLGHNFAFGQQIVTGPQGGLDYATGCINGYTEHGGGSANLLYPDDNFESMTGRLGWSVSYLRDAGFLGRMTAQFRAGWAHEFMPEADLVSASLVQSPFLLIQGNRAARLGGFGASRDGAHPGQDWLELGAGLRFDLDCGANLKFDYQGQFGRDGASAHFGSVKLGYEF